MNDVTVGYQKKRKTEQPSRSQRSSSHQQQRVRPVRQQQALPSKKALPSLPRAREKTIRLDEPTSSLPEKLWGIQEACQFFGLSRTSVFRLIRKHSLPVYKIGGRNRFDPREVWQWLQAWHGRQSL